MVLGQNSLRLWALQSSMTLWNPVMLIWDKREKERKKEEREVR